MNPQTIQVFESISDAFLALDEKWRVRFVSRQAEKLWAKPCFIVDRCDLHWEE